LLISAARSPAELDDLVDRRVAGFPLEHLLGWAQFCGQRVAVGPGVFVPRRRTELLVEQGAAAATRSVAAGRTAIVVDLCCGSGAVGVALAATLGHIELHCVDIDPAAVQCARGNVSSFGGQVYDGDLYDPLPDRLRGQVDVLAANAPYVPTESIAMMPPEARLHEARVALDGGIDGLAVQCRFIEQAPQWLATTGSLVIETSRLQADQTVAECVEAGLAARVVTSTDRDATVVVATRSAGRP
jgi:release factor glutamine methyltransferase